jgi:HPt (histidine-containing phosphotransfer) domain-containing protein
MEHQDSGAIGALGHRIKSTASAVGATELAELGRMLEATRTSGDLGLARELVDRLAAHTNKIKLLLELEPGRTTRLRPVPQP